MDTQDTVQPDIYDADGNIIDLDAAIASGRVMVCKNGVLKDTVTKKFVRGGNPTTAIKTSSQAAQMATIRHQRKRERIEAGALAAVMDRMPDKFTGGDGDWIEAVAEQVTRKALDPLDSQQVNAARFLFTEAGLAEDRAQQRAAVTVDMGSDDDLLLVVMRRRMQADDVVDGDIVDGDEGQG